MAPAHTCSCATLNPVNVSRAYGSVYGVENFALGNGLAAADNPAVTLILCNKLFTFFLCHIAETNWCRTTAVKVCFLLGSGLFGEKLRDIFCNGGRSGKTRRFYTRNIDKAVVFIGIAYYKVIRNRMRSDTCKRCYCASDIYVRNGFQSLRENKLKALGSCIHIVLIILIRRRRADKKVAVNDKTDSLTNKVVHIPQIINRIMMNDVRKRMGDIRSAEGTHGAWVRYNGGEMSGRGIDNDFNMIQVGFDTMPGADAPRFGVAFSYANSEAEDGYGTADMDAYSLAAYATKFYDNGMFVDVIGRLAKIDTDLDNVGMTGKMDNLAVSLSGEFGWRFDVTKSLYVEPAVEATYTYMDSDEFTLGQGEYELESTDSFIGRAGIAAGFKCPANKGDVYVRAAVAHEFLGDATMNSSINGHRAAAVELDGKDTWIEFGLGANFNVNESSYVYADVERTEGAAIDEDWRANVGVRFAF